MTKLKICGLRDPHSALVAAESGADLLGFNFVPGVRRQLTLGQGMAIVAEYRRFRGEGGPGLVGLFADQPVERVNHIVGECGLEYAQLCGDETPEYWSRVAVPVIRQIKVHDEGPLADAVVETEKRVREVLSEGHVPLLDRYEKGALGGTGASFDWRIAQELSDRHRALLAGGLNPDNVRAAIAEVGPWGVDVSSGVETDGVKDAGKIKAFAEAVRSYGARVGNPRAK